MHHEGIPRYTPAYDSMQPLIRISNQCMQNFLSVLLIGKSTQKLHCVKFIVHMAHLFAVKTLVGLKFEIQSKSILHISKTKVFHSNISVQVEELFL